jgi:hypothetical protein
MMMPTTKTSHLFRRYLPKKTDLAIRREQLLVSVKDWGEIGGQWPHYRVQMTDPMTDTHLALTYTGRHLIWWADLPKIFTYFAAFGEFQGTVSIKGHEHTISGVASFEHGFARKPFAYDNVLRPLRWLQKLLRFTLMQYHYNLLIGEDGVHGGMMLAQGVGIDFRNLGGIYFPDGSFERLTEVEVVYTELEEIASPGLAQPVTFPKRWVVRAKVAGGTLEYTATRQSPLARIAKNMSYFDFHFTGMYRGRRDLPLIGHGYGEYVRI